MAVYAIFGNRSAAELDARVVAVFPDRRQVAPGQWLVAYAGSLAADVYQAMKNAGGDIWCVITPTNYYYGYGDKAVWDWVEANRGAFDMPSVRR